MYYLADFSKLNQAEQNPKKESELKKWGRVGALGAASIVPGVGIAYALGKKLPKNKKMLVNSAIVTGGALGSLGTYGAYRAGKSIYNRVLKGKKNDKK